MILIKNINAGSNISCELVKEFISHFNNCSDPIISYVNKRSFNFENLDEVILSLPNKQNNDDNIENKNRNTKDKYKSDKTYFLYVVKGFVILFKKKETKKCGFKLDYFIYLSTKFHDINESGMYTATIKGKLNKRNLLLFKNKETFIKYTKHSEINLLFKSDKAKSKFIRKLL